jgi:ATP-dependent DNA ligase
MATACGFIPATDTISPADHRGSTRLKVRSCFIDGEAIVVDERGLSAFDLLRSWRHDHAAVSAPLI